ncbi:hypothetical protein [Pseudonocardia sp. KRD291]|uniref:hypothetical protein n=1 Tax=Pseudonocardia sp. KRD291 TaxID=2792007 RepID=UPI001C4A7351|nr:hypothetical protein [Pseudonocardia sp. KRD291]MBW0105718.1 hypothetical protein [Pseudonocardia sp. KRD291]
MNTAMRLSAYGAAVALLGAGAYVTGSAVDAPTTHLQPTAQSGPVGHGGSHSGAVAEVRAPEPGAPASNTAQPAGLASTKAGYTFAPATTTLTPGKPTELAFRITGPDSKPVTAFDVEHEKRMHLILVRSDTADFQHVHPAMSADGTWRAPVTLAGGGTYRAFADFTPGGGEATTLRADLFAPGAFTPVAPKPNRVATAPGGYQVRLDGDLKPGQASEVTLSVARNGRPVTDLQPYLGAYGHLVALRGGDLGYLHVHPEGVPGDGATTPGPQIRFAAEVPTAGTYRLFLDFRHGSEVRTVQFTVPTTGAIAAAAPAGSAPSAEAGHTHSEGGH